MRVPIHRMTHVITVAKATNLAKTFRYLTCEGAVRGYYLPKRGSTVGRCGGKRGHTLHRLHPHGRVRGARRQPLVVLDD